MDADRELIERCRSGDREAQQALYVQTVDRLYRLLLRMMGNADDAFDIAQNTYLLAIQAIGEFRGESSLATWLFRIAVNEVRQFRRRNGRDLRHLEIKARLDSNDATAEESIATGMDVDAALAAVESEDRAILLLRYDQGLNYREIASTLACAEGTVASRLNRARARMREILGKGYLAREETSRTEHLNVKKDIVDYEAPSVRVEDVASLRVKSTDG